MFHPHDPNVCYIQQCVQNLIPTKYKYMRMRELVVCKTRGMWLLAIYGGQAKDSSRTISETAIYLRNVN